MQPIKTLYVINHSHTDIGFTDFQDVCFRQHSEFIERALELIEATDGYPEEARYHWTCETTGPLIRHLRQCSPAQRERFRYWHERGRIDVAGMKYNLTPLLNVEQMHRTLYPVRELREEYGLRVEAAMQDDVNGVSWLFADLLPAIAIHFLTMAVNPIRGGAPKPRPSAFWWEGAGGGRVLAWNGYHYLWGRSIAGLGDWRFVDQFLPPWIRKLEEDPNYPFEFLCAESTHPMRVDNGPPDRRMPQFVRQWNEEGRVPRIVFTTTTEFGRILRQRYGERLAVKRGDWTDWWADGVASSAYETGLNRTTHEVLLAAECLLGWMKASGGCNGYEERLADIYDNAILYDEHTWGAFSSIAAPDSLFTRAQWNRKASFAYSAAMEAHGVLARAVHAVAGSCSDAGTEGLFNLGRLEPEAAYPPSGAAEVLVINTLPWARRVVVEEPEIRGGAAPDGMLDMFFPRDVPWGGLRPVTPRRRIAGEVPGFGYGFLPVSNAPPQDDLRIEPLVIENAHYRIRVHPQTGALTEWLVVTCKNNS
jgi:hypothetical protein